MLLHLGGTLICIAQSTVSASVKKKKKPSELSLSMLIWEKRKIEKTHLKGSFIAFLQII